MAQVKVVIDGVPYYGTSAKDDDLIGAILQLHCVLKDHGAPISKILQGTIDIASRIVTAGDTCVHCERRKGQHRYPDQRCFTEVTGMRGTAETSFTPKS